MNTNLINKTTSAIPEASTLSEKNVLKYQHYISARTATRLITKEGKRIVFTGYEFYTQDEDIISYLDAEIKQRLPGITKGKLMSFAEKDPMEKLKTKLREELREEMAQEAADRALGKSKDMGESKQKGAASINPASTKNVAN